MEELTAQTISFVVMVGLNLLAAGLLWVEYAGNRARYLKMVAIGQSFAVLWHVVNLWLTFYAVTDLSLALSTVMMFFCGLYYLAASTFERVPTGRRTVGAAVIYSVVVFAGGAIYEPVFNWAWLLIYLIVLATPVATAMYCNLKSTKWILASLQLVVAVTLILGTYLLNTPYAAIGGLFYLLNAMFLPIVAVKFIMVSVRLSRLKIAEKERDYRTFFDSVNEVFFRSDMNGNILEISPSVAQFGTSPDLMLGRNLAEHLTNSQSYIESMQQSISTAQPLQYAGAFRTRRGNIDCEVVCSPIVDRKSREIHFSGAIRNTHERNLLEKQFIDAQRHESLGVLAGGVAHDFNNLLQGITGHAELLLRKGNIDRERLERHVSAILRASASAGNLCRQLLHYTGKGFESQQHFNLNDTLKEVVELLRPSLPDGVKMSLTLPSSPALMSGDTSQVGQIFLNLVKNAMDAVGNQGQISVSAEVRDIKASFLREIHLLGSLTPGKYHEVTVQDDGPGIDPAIQSRIFEPFFSTKQGGHGLGLAAITGILRTHNGGISVESNPGHGSTFRVLVPCLTHDAVLAGKSSVNIHASEKRILLVDDDSTVREVAKMVLEEAGHETLVADHGLGALAVFEQTGTHIDLVITDIKMPEMDGVTLARKLREKAPLLPIILVTGYADFSDQLTVLESSQFKLIRKPYRAAELLTAIDSVMGGPAAVLARRA